MTRLFIMILCVLAVGALFFLAGSYLTLDYFTAHLKAQVDIAIPSYEPEEYYRYGGGPAFEHQMDQIRLLGKQEIITALDSLCVDFRPWHPLRGVL